jgi:hypothetical protein
MKCFRQIKLNWYQLEFALKLDEYIEIQLEIIPGISYFLFFSNENYFNIIWVSVSNLKDFSSFHFITLGV